VPPSLVALCAGYFPGSLIAAHGIKRLLTSLDVLDEGFGAAIEAESPDVTANVRAHRRLFERLGFFAEGEDGALWAFDFASGVDEPPVAALDTEGQYLWIGIDLAEVLRQDGRWTVSTQFLPQLADLHADYYSLEMGTPRPKRFPSPLPAVGGDPESWLLRPGGEIAAVLAGVLPAEEVVACGGEGLVTTVWLPREGPLASLPVRGVVLGADARSVRERLGAPTIEGPRWMRFDGSGRALHLEVDGGAVTRITLMTLDVTP
jgi:hypothetical protein